jgi:hypothetical protein
MNELYFVLSHAKTLFVHMTYDIASDKRKPKSNGHVRRQHSFKWLHRTQCSHTRTPQHSTRFLPHIKPILLSHSLRLHILTVSPSHPIPGADGSQSPPNPPPLSPGSFLTRHCELRLGLLFRNQGIMKHMQIPTVSCGVMRATIMHLKLPHHPPSSFLKPPDTTTFP